MLIQGRLERMETNLMHFKWEVTWSLGNQSNTFKVVAIRPSAQMHGDLNTRDTF